MMNACARWSFLAVPVLAALGCSDPVPLPAQGAISLSVTKPSGSDLMTGTDCPVPGITYSVGTKKSTVPTMSNPGESVIDGEGGAEVSCSVKGKGTFTFSGSLKAATIDTKDPITVTFTNGQIGADFTGTATVSVFTPQLAGTYTSAAGGCKVKVINSQVKGGSIWASFTCPGITVPPSQQCSVGTSVFVFENCDGS